MTFWDKVEKACEAVDTWPDWRLDTVSLKARNKRRAEGEVLPKPTKEQQWRSVADKLAEALESLSSRLKIITVANSEYQWICGGEIKPRILEDCRAALAQYKEMK